jgi:membrane protein required for colicin V production
LTGFDYIVLVIIGLSLVISIMRGAIREVLAIAGWAAAIVAAKTFASQLAPLLPNAIPTEMLKTTAAFLIILLLVLLIANLLSTALTSIFKMVGINWLNRFFGAFFGFARGLLIVSILVLLAGMTDIPKDERWRNAMLSSPLEMLVISALPWLPEGVSKHVKFG